jgi:serine/threonine protein phosphatase PrpC
LVLPDHFYDGLVESYQDHFPLGTNFVLCSDGFYNCFSETGDMWQWLTEHSRALSNMEEKELVLQQLHNQLDKKRGDDDISFIWTFPSKENVSCS